MLPTPVTIFSLMRTKDEEALVNSPPGRGAKKKAGGFILKVSLSNLHVRRAKRRGPAITKLFWIEVQDKGKRLRFDSPIPTA